MILVKDFCDRSEGAAATGKRTCSLESVKCLNIIKGNMDSKKYIDFQYGTKLWFNWRFLAKSPFSSLVNALCASVQHDNVHYASASTLTVSTFPIIEILTHKQSRISKPIVGLLEWNAFAQTVSMYVP
ncbi:hypothetical protein PHYBLDRAFT_69705 [Phycomyces blakesleeanus NRRL 1555(-)]|uniref:Uncharacterized protein n=1 Tax=Phycomyces blakesleeanus (strain ATCC 8743b / DSM 1359 / FGSC 10004 / NBRC 33097 / NRRL 1555) TaxID=763407 RepID=A0A167PQB2_PHYB8|nr:hypothetical protein PHYBLDRAFT_69705 [Phycomyces blakesleeanus NRRL 1555(-)]OAD78349.1 hypothetical protein PHYBLDRAFT_69705 [Phycomyces blakesleeanus NRRL 1555(-)]|eukprot:XP_018296389.1 hypothetical protein PHYBLDRAFT_69705 [Phycomyces blakesleeanus NRRL 1555(-)]